MSQSEPPPTPQELLSVAVDSAKAAGVFILKKSREELKINEEVHHDIKLQLDVDSQQLLTEAILQRFPEHDILGEEGGEGSTTGGYEWILDPIDGTVNLAYGIPHFCVSVACRKGDEVLAGAIYDPVRDEMFSASRGGGAFLNGESIHVSSRKDIKQAIMALGFSKHSDSIDKCLELYHYYGPKARKLRAMGSAALDMAFISAGRLDVYIEQGIKIWDIAAGWLLLEEAGGQVILTPHPTQPHHFHIVASNGLLELPRV